MQEVITVTMVCSQLIPKLIVPIVQKELLEVRVTVYVPARLCRIEGGVKVVLWESSVDRLDPAQLLTWTFGVYCMLYSSAGFTKGVFI